MSVTLLVSYAVKRFVDNLPAIFEGSFNHALLEDEGEEGRLLQLFKTVARQQVFNHSEVEQLELQGYRVIKGLLEIYQPLMRLNYEAFTTLMNEDFLRQHPIETRLFHKLSGKHRKAYLHKIVIWLWSINISGCCGSVIIASGLFRIILAA